jgi:hypothetical protein
MADSSIWNPKVSVPVIGTIAIIVLSAVSQLITSPAAGFWMTVSVGILIALGFLISVFLSSADTKSLTIFYTIVVAMILYSGVIVSSYTGAYLIQDTSPILASVFTIFLGVFLFLIYYGAVVESRGYFFYVGLVGVVVVYIYYLSTAGNPAPSQTEGFSNGGVGGGWSGSAPAPSSSQFGGYPSLFRADAEATSPGPAQRSLVDATFLTVAYPTLGPNDDPPIHNTDQVQGLHSLDNLRATLGRGATALFMDVYYEDISPSSRFPKSWRVGTLNTMTGVIQNKRTIGLASALAEVQRMIQSASATGNPRTYVLVLNPRYTSDQMKRIGKLEDALAKTIQDTIQSCKAIPYSATAGAVSGKTAEDPLAAARLSQVQNQVVVVMGGPREPSSTALRNVIQGTVNLAKVSLDNSSGNAGNPVYSLTYVPNTPQPTFAGNVLASNHGNASTSSLTPQNRSVQNKAIGLPQLVMMFPDAITPANKPMYPSNDLPHITYGASFPVVFTRTLTLPGYNANIGLFNGFALAQNERLVRSAIYSNLAPVADPRNGGTLYCGGNANDVIDPKADAEWDKVMLPTVKRTTWCEDSKKNVFPFDMRPVVLYRPRELTEQDNKTAKNVVDLAGKTDVPGIIPKPTVVDYWFDGSRVGLYRLRAVIMSQTVVGKSLD